MRSPASSSMLAFPTKSAHYLGSLCSASTLQIQSSMFCRRHRAQIQGSSYLLGQRFSACFVLKFALQSGEGFFRLSPVCSKFTFSLRREWASGIRNMGYRWSQSVAFAARKKTERDDVDHPSSILGGPSVSRGRGSVTFAGATRACAPCLPPKQNTKKGLFVCKLRLIHSQQAFLCNWEKSAIKVLQKINGAW